MKDDNKSPRLSHLVKLVKSYNVPRISDRIYHSQYDYVQAAKFNHLNKFRNLPGKSNLVVPPLVE